MINYKFKIENENGDFIYLNDHVTDPLRFFALQEYPDFDVDIKNSELAKDGQHGIFDFFSFYGKRLINFNGVMVGEDESDIEILKAKLLKVISLPPNPSSDNDGYLTISWTDANDNNWQIKGKLNSYPKFDRNLRQLYRLSFQLTFKCNNPEIESQEENTASGIRGWRQGALLIPSSLPAMFNVVYDNLISITNTGSISAQTIITIKGEDTITVSNPYILNVTTNKLFKVNIVLNGSDKFITINSKTGTVVDQDGVDRSGLVDSTSEYILLAIGENKLVFLSDESFNANSPVNTWKYPEAVVDIKHKTTII